jgi:hypothetical protein
MNTYNVTVSTKAPVTIWYNGRGIVPTRQIIYRTIQRLQIHGTLCAGIVTYHHKHIIVKATHYDVNRGFEGWEAAKLIDPFAYTRVAKNDKTL